ncbi:unnamed protein product [Cylicocyclus nassatus]|uniref:Uncharacterized protein n=1 Tax=Cylicocyclus nassatus TaxID=53992 RepID=A0AA36GTB4_CYLNA|nr:unnamed protein product [Cylicocyclus nassatus]
MFPITKKSNVRLFYLSVVLFLLDSVKPDGFYSAYGMICGIRLCSILLSLLHRAKALHLVIFDCSSLLPLVPPENGTLQFSVLSHPGGGKKNRPLGGIGVVLIT